MVEMGTRQPWIEAKANAACTGCDEQVPRLRKVASSFIKILKQFLRAVRKAREGEGGSAR